MLFIANFLIYDFTVYTTPRGFDAADGTPITVLNGVAYSNSWYHANYNAVI